MRRKPLKRRTSRKVFAKGNRVHPKNTLRDNPMRGGIRL